MEDIQLNCGTKTIQYDCRDGLSGDIVTYECTLNDYFSIITENQSDHDDSIYMMDENILQITKMDDAIQIDKDMFIKNLFNYFPERIRPKNALIIGGTGSRSFLHADPYEWTGWNYLLSGRKLWIFLPHTEELNSILLSRRNSSDAWNGETDSNRSSSSSIQYDLSISAGWVSDVDLFYKRSSYSIHDVIRKILLMKSVKKLIQTICDSMSIEQEVHDKKGSKSLVTIRRKSQIKILIRKIKRKVIRFYQKYPKQQWSLFACHFQNWHWIEQGISEMLHDLITTTTNHLDFDSFTKMILNSEYFAKTVINIPCFMPRESSIFESGVEESDPTSDRFSDQMVQIIQEPGECVIIPPKMWHQVYHLAPSVAVALQCCHESNKFFVFNHIMDCCYQHRRQNEPNLLLSDLDLETLFENDPSIHDELQSLFQYSRYQPSEAMTPKRTFDHLMDKVSIASKEQSVKATPSVDDSILISTLLKVAFKLKYGSVIGNDIHRQLHQSVI